MYCISDTPALSHLLLYWYPIMSPHFHSHLPAAYWMNAFRRYPLAKQKTTNALESFHSILKQELRLAHGRLAGRRLDWIVFFLSDEQYGLEQR